MSELTLLIDLIRRLNKIHSLEDAIYDIRERECLGWEGPKVKEYSSLIDQIERITGKLNG